MPGVSLSPHRAVPPPPPAITVIIASSCEAQRASALCRAIDSVLGQEDVLVDLVVVANGARMDRALYEALLADARFRTCFREEGSFPAAVRHGREQVRHPYFSFLDDDDYYLPGALRTRHHAIEQPSPVDFVCTNGHVEAGGRRQLFVEDVALLKRDPLGAHFAFNWLGSSAGLFRTETVTPDFFDGVTKHFEWTWLTHRLLTSRRSVRFVDVPTFYKTDTPGSLSKDASEEPLLTELRLLETMEASARPEHHHFLSRKIRGALHALSHFHAVRGRLDVAWAYHLRSLRCRGGWHHLPYTRRLAAGSLSQWWRARQNG